MSLTAENKDIKLPKRHFVGMIGRAEDTLPLGFMVPDGTDKAAQTRKDGVKRWMDDEVRYGGAIAAEKVTFQSTRELENTPQVGFRLTRSIKRDSRYGGNVKWRIEDPRGFELEISSANMATVMVNCVLDNGEILDECVWGRLKSDNILIPLSSDLYKAMMRNEERAAAKVNPKDIERGDYVVLQNGVEGLYLGQFYKLVQEHDSHYGERTMFAFKWTSKPVHILVRKANRDWEDEEREYIYDVVGFKPAYVTKGTTLTPEEALARVQKINESRHTSQWFYLERSKLEVTLEPITVEQMLRYSRVVAKQGDTLVRVIEYGRQWGDAYRLVPVTIDKDGDYIQDFNNQRGAMRSELANMELFGVTAKLKVGGSVRTV